MRINPNANPEMYQQMLAKLDKDGDGQISDQEKSEARAARGPRGGQGARPARGVSEGEGMRGKGPGGRMGGEIPQEVLDRLDTNGDGTVSEEERAAGKAQREAKHQEVIATYDQDGDGTLNEEERAAAREAMGPPPEGARGGRMGGGTRGMGRGDGAGRLGGAGPFGPGEPPAFAPDLQRLGSLARSIQQGSEPEVSEVQSAYDETEGLGQQIQESEVPDAGKERLLSRMDSIRATFANFLQNRLGANFVV